jgi:hypothetical protein
MKFRDYDSLREDFRLPAWNRSSQFEHYKSSPSGTEIYLLVGKGMRDARLRLDRGGRKVKPAGHRGREPVYRGELRRASQGRGSGEAWQPP